ncbi:hypothetical protein ES288_D05G400000v1 [Gossypium darwinii]|uniref:BZIP domain-containing protein n=1 Tax=Gossypium darwinii TaxID=34276 RepID=A0A5D2CRZ1_GOSDA|nr:hypothetical protein ES288_D05G400000v1 [Gossypium darwinii]
MEGYSSDGSTSFFGSNIPSEPQLPQQIDSLGVVDGWLELLGRDNGLVQDNIDFSAVDDGPTVRSLLDQHHQFNQGETSEASYQTVSEGGTRSKLTPAQRKENKRQSDYKYRQKRKVTADEQIGEIKRLKEEIQRFNVENGELKAQLGLLLLNAQFQAAAQQRQDGYITQSTGKQLHPQYVTVRGTNSEAVDKMNEIQNLQGTVPVNVVDGNDGIAKNQRSSEVETCSNNEAAITDILMKLEADDESRVKFSDFTGLHGERISVGKYSFPLALHPIVNNIIEVYGDVSATSKMNPSIAETVYIMFCASVKEMSNLRLEHVTEDLILKWRDAIKDALRVNFKVDFAMEHLKKIACAYIGLMERQKLDSAGLRISKLEAELSAAKEEHAKICEQSKVFMDAAEEFNDKPVSSGFNSRLNWISSKPYYPAFDAPLNRCRRKQFSSNVLR